MNEIDANRLKKVFNAAGETAAAAAGRFAERADTEGLVAVAYARYDSPIGGGLVAATDRGIVAVALPNRSSDEFVDELAAAISPRVLELPQRLDAARRELDEYFDGTRQRFDLPIDWRMVRSPFANRVLRETARVPFGATATYGELAARVGSPRAHRAAGSALGRNPIPIVVPCHRVLRAGGLIGQYGGGAEMKEWLLRMEGAVG